MQIYKDSDHKITKIYYHQLKFANFHKSYEELKKIFIDPNIESSKYDIDWNDKNLKVFELVSNHIVSDDSSLRQILELDDNAAFILAHTDMYVTNGGKNLNYFYVLENALPDSDEQIKDIIMNQLNTILGVVVKNNIDIPYSKFLTMLNNKTNMKQAKKLIIELSAPSNDFIVSKNMSFQLWKNDEKWIFFGKETDFDFKTNTKDRNILVEKDGIMYGNFLSKSDEVNMMLSLKYIS